MAVTRLSNEQLAREIHFRGGLIVNHASRLVSMFRDKPRGYIHIHIHIYTTSFLVASSAKTVSDLARVYLIFPMREVQKLNEGLRLDNTTSPARSIKSFGMKA